MTQLAPTDGFKESGLENRANRLNDLIIESKAALVVGSKMSAITRPGIEEPVEQLCAYGKLNDGTDMIPVAV